MVSLADYLAGQQRVGSYDSTGHFAVDLAGRRHKLARFQLADLEEGLLKILQGAIQMDPACIHIEASPRELSISIHNPAVARAGTRLASDFEAILLDSQESLLRDLAMGLLAFQTDESIELWWSRWSGGQVLEVLSLMGTPGRARLRQPYRVEGENVVCFQIRSRTPLKLNRGRVSSRLSFSPVPLTWNGASVPYTAPSGGALVELYRLDGALGCRGMALKAGAAARVWSGPPIPVTAKWRPPAQLRCVSGSPSPRAVGAWAASLHRLDTNSPSLLTPIKYGVTLQSLSLPAVPGLRVVAAVPDLAVDLGQFRLREDERLEQFRIDLSQQLLEGMKSLLSLSPPCPPSRNRLLAGLAVAAAAAAMNPWTLPPLAAVAALGRARRPLSPVEWEGLMTGLRLWLGRLPGAGSHHLAR